MERNIIIDKNAKPPKIKWLISQLKHLIEQAERRGIPPEDERKLLEELETA